MTNQYHTVRIAGLLARVGYTFVWQGELKSITGVNKERGSLHCGLERYDCDKHTIIEVLDYNHFKPEGKIERIAREHAEMKAFIKWVAGRDLIESEPYDNSMNQIAYHEGLNEAERFIASQARNLLATLG